MKALELWESTNNFDCNTRAVIIVLKNLTRIYEETELPEKVAEYQKQMDLALSRLSTAAG